MLIAVVGVAVALTRDGTAPEPEPDPPPPPTTPVVVETTEPVDPDPTETEPPDYVAFDRLLDDSGRITVDVPRPWGDVDGSPWVIDGTEVGLQIVAAPDLDRFRSSWAVPGVIFGASELLRESFDPTALLDALDFSDQCTYEGRSTYSDPAYDGFRDDYSDCGGTGTAYTLIAAEPADEDELVLVQFQAVDARDEGALDRVIETFFVLPADDPDAGPAEEAPEPGDG